MSNVLPITTDPGLAPKAACILHGAGHSPQQLGNLAAGAPAQPAQPAAGGASVLGKRAAELAGGDAKRARKEDEEDVGVDVLKVGRVPLLPRWLRSACPAHANGQ